MTVVGDMIADVTSRHLIYGLVDPRTMMVRYVGLSSRWLKRPQEHGLERMLAKDDTHKARWIRTLRSAGLDYSIAVLQESTKESLANDERWWIAYGRASGWPLTNETDGGGGRLGLPHSPETRARIGAAHKGRVVSDDTRAKQSAVHKARGWSPSDEHRALLSAVNRGNGHAVGNKSWVGRKHTDESKAKMSASLSGRVLPDETRARMSAAHVGKRHSDEARKAMSAAQAGNKKWLGKRHTPETREKMAAARRAYWAAKKEFAK